MTKAGFYASLTAGISIVLTACNTIDSAVLTKTPTFQVRPASTNVVPVVVYVTNATPVVAVSTNTVRNVTSDGVTNWTHQVLTVTNWNYSVLQQTNWSLQVIPASTNVVYDLDIKPEVNQALALSKMLPWPIVGQVAAVIGLLMQGYVAMRRSQLNKALTLAIEQQRNVLTEEQDKTFVENLVQTQQALGVHKEASALLMEQKLSSGRK